MADFRLQVLIFKYDLAYLRWFDHFSIGAGVMLRSLEQVLVRRRRPASSVGLCWPRPGISGTTMYCPLRRELRSTPSGHAVVVALAAAEAIRIRRTPRCEEIIRAHMWDDGATYAELIASPWHLWRPLARRGVGGGGVSPASQRSLFSIM